MPDSNILYSHSYVISGQGYAVVCAVGFKTQYGIGMSCPYSEKELNYSFLEGWRKDLQSLENRILYLSMFVCIFFLCEVFGRVYPTHSRGQGPDESRDNIWIVLTMVVTLITMFMAMYSSYGISVLWAITTSTQLDMFEEDEKRGYVKFKDIIAFEQFGKVDCVVIEKQETLTDRYRAEIKIEDLYINMKGQI